MSHAFSARRLIIKRATRDGIPAAESASDGHDAGDGLVLLNYYKHVFHSNER